MLVLFAVMRKKNMRTARNIFIFNLAFSDMILGASLPFIIMDKLSKQFPLPHYDITCRYIHTECSIREAIKTSLKWLTVAMPY